MPNSITAAGLTLASYSEMYTNLSNAMYQIYGFDINLASNAPDGQFLNIVLQIALDIQDLVQQVYNMQDPDNAIGVILDQRVAINGIQRQAGTFTVTPVTVSISRTLNLYGLDYDQGEGIQPIFTVADESGNQFELQVTQLGINMGDSVLNFQAAVPGAVLTVPDTITTQVTIVLGVTGVNNPSTYTTLGLNEESDAQLKVRRQQSVSLASQGFLASLYAALGNINGVTSKFIYENLSDAVDSDGVPGHSIWVIVGGSATAADIAQAIYTKRNAGCGMFGAQSFTIDQVDGTEFNVYWDDVTTQDLFIAFTATGISPNSTPNVAAIRAALPTLYTPGVNAEVNINQLATLVQQIDPNTLVTAAGFSNGETQIATLSDVSASGAFEVRYDGVNSASIAWNDAIGTIQTKVRAITGLALINVTGSIASRTLAFDLTNVPEIQGLLTVVSNTLVTSGSVAITFTWNEGYANTLSPDSKKNQFTVTAANVIILAMILTPSGQKVSPSATVQLVALGGYGTYVYSIQTNTSGGSVNSSSGVYTAGSTPGVDTVKATDAFGNIATTTITVT